MTSNKNVWIAIIVVAIIAICGLFFPKIQRGFGATITATDVTATRFTQLLVDNGIMVSAGGLNVAGGMVNDGITTTYTRNTSMTAATTTPCAVQNGTATSTIVRAWANFTVSSTTASLVTFATSTSAFATTTLLASSTFVANASGYVYYAGPTGSSVIAPNNWVVMSMSGGIGSFSPTGTCGVVLQALN